MTICKNWRDIVTDDVKLIVDCDTFIFTAASSNTDKIFKVILKSTGEEFFKEKDVEQFETVCTNSHVLGAFYNGDEEPIYEKRSTGKYENKRFKNKTEFKGRKKVIGGWLGEHNFKRESEGKEPYKIEDFEFEEELIPNEIHFAYGNFNRKIQEVKDYLGIQEAVLLVGVDESHRSYIETPINPRYPEFPERGRYKGMRLMKKPPQLEQVRDYVIEKKGGIAIEGVEADDALNFYMNESYLHYKKHGKHKYVGVSIDKDSRSFNSLIFDFTKTKDNTWKYPDLLLVDGLGELYLNDKGAVKGDGYLHFMFQMTAGDDCDNYHMSKYMGTSFGPKAAYNLLKDCKTVKEACEAVVSQYYRIFPDNVVTFKSWSGKMITTTTYGWMDDMFKLVYMLKSRDDKTVFTGILDQLGVHYKTNPNLDEPNKTKTKEDK